MKLHSNGRGWTGSSTASQVSHLTVQEAGIHMGQGRGGGPSTLLWGPHCLGPPQESPHRHFQDDKLVKWAQPREVFFLSDVPEYTQYSIFPHVHHLSFHLSLPNFHLLFYIDKLREHLTEVLNSPLILLIFPVVFFMFGLVTESVAGVPCERWPLFYPKRKHLLSCD